MSRRVAVIFVLSLLVILFVSFLGKVNAQRQQRLECVVAWTRAYNLEHEWVKIWINQDGTIDLSYNITIKLDSGDDINYVIVGQPNGYFTIGEAADQYGNSLVAYDVSSGSDYRVRVNLATPLTAGQSIWFTLITNVAHMIYEDIQNPGNVGMQFVPCWWATTIYDLRVLIVLPLNVTVDEVKTSVDWNNTLYEDSRLAVYWEKQNLLSNEKFPVGVSFPKEYVQAYETIRRVHNLNTGSNYTSIQEAIAAPETLDGHKILVDAGTYNESVFLNKAVSLIGENKTNTVINGYGAQWAVYIASNNVTVSGLTIKNGGNGLPSPIIPNGGIKLVSNYSTISNNVIVDNGYSGIWCGYYTIANGNSIEDNFVSNNFYGIALSSGSSFNNLTRNVILNNMHMGMSIESKGNFLRLNLMSHNTYNFGVWGYSVSDLGHDIDTSNKVDGKPIYYLVNKSDVQVPPDAGYIAVISCRNVTINYAIIRDVGALFFVNVTDSVLRNMEISNTYYWGIYLLDSHHNILRNLTLTNPSLYNLELKDSNGNIIEGNFIANGGTGIDLYNSSGNTITRNVITHNDHAIFLAYSDSNRMYYNNFVDNTVQIPIGAIKEDNTWDNGYLFGGNYWSDYIGTDLFSGSYQNITGSDGIGDIPYIIDADNQQMDRYPLMGMFRSFNTSLDCFADVISNSTVDSFEYFEFNNTIKMYVSNMTANQTYGFCRLRIPHALMNETYHVTINGTEPYYWNYTLHDDGDSRWIYFSYQHSTLEIVIVPEFPSFLILPLFMIATLLTVVVCRRKQLTIGKR